jgi:hypothetical protein
VVLKGLPHTQNDPPAVGQNPPHLAHGGGAVRKKL